MAAEVDLSVNCDVGAVCANAAAGTETSATAAMKVLFMIAPITSVARTTREPNP
jgi:hypothetical protein